MRDIMDRYVPSFRAGVGVLLFCIILIVVPVVADVPVAAFSANTTTGTSPQAIQFTDESTNTPTIWLWDFGDGNSLNTTVQNPVHWYSPGTFTVNLTATNSEGSSSLVKTSYITVASNGLANQAVNPGFETGMTGWTLVDSTVNSGISTVQKHSGSYSMVMSLGNAKGSSISQYVDLTGVTTISFYHYLATTKQGWLYVYIDGTQVGYTSSLAKNSWQQRSFPISGYSGVHNITLRYSAAANSYLDYFDDIVIMPSPVASFTATPTTGIAPLSVQFTDTSTNTPTSWSWNFGDSSTSTSQNPATHTYSAAGNYTVVLTATNDGGSSSSTQYITVIDKPITAFSANATSGFKQLAVLFTDASTNSPTSWLWDFGDGGSSTDRNATHFYTRAGNYTVNLTASNIAGSNSTLKTKYISITTDVQAPVAAFSADKLTGNKPFTITFTDASTNWPTEWLWDFGDGNSTNATVQNPVHTYSSVGTYSVNLTASNEGGSNSCTRTGYITILNLTPLSNYRFININVANDEGVKYNVENGVYASGGTYTYVPNTYWVMFRTAGGGDNPMHMSATRYAYSSADITSTTDQSGSFFITFSGGQPTLPDAILMLAVNGTIPDDFKVHIRSSGQDFDVGEPATTNLYQDGTTPIGTFLDGAVDQTFDKNDFTYGPQSWKPYSSSGYPLYSGEIQTDPINQFQLMFIDLRVGAIQNMSLTNNGMIKVEYNFTDLQSTAVFNSYGWYMQSNHGTGIIMGNNVDGSGYTVHAIKATPVANFTASTTAGYVLSPIVFNDTSTNSPNSWLWDFGDGNTSALKNPTHAYSSVSTYTVKLTATNTLGSNVTTKTNFIAVTMPTSPVAGFAANATSGSYPFTVQFTDTTGNGAYSWLWNFGDGKTSNEQNPVHTYTKGGTYTVKLTATNAVGSNTTSQAGYITTSASSVPVASFTGTPVNGIAPLTVTFTDTSTNSPATWVWDFGDNATSAVQNPIHTFGSVGTYSVNLTVANSHGTGNLTKNGLVYVTSATGSLPNYTDIYVRAANHDGIRWNDNDNGTYYVPSGSTGGGLNNVLKITTDPDNTTGQTTVTTDKSGTFYVTGTSQDEIVLLLAVNGTIPDNFAARIKTRGYTWTPTGSAPASGYTYQSSALDQTFTKSDFFYGPQNWKPTQGNANYPLYAGEDMNSPAEQYQLMFIDTRAGLLSGSSLTDNGAVRIDYNFTNLPDSARFNVYGWKTTSGMGWTNDINSSGYSVIQQVVVIPPVADFTANQTEGLVPFNVRFHDTTLNTPTSWAWDFGDGSTSVKKNPEYTYDSAGTYTVKLTATNSKGSDTKTRAGFITVSAPVTTTNSFALTGVTATMSGTTQTIAVNITNSTVVDNVVTVTNVSDTWDHLTITLDNAPASTGENWFGTVTNVTAVTQPVTVPLASLGNPNVTFSLHLTKIPDSTSSITSTITSDPPTSQQSSFTAAATGDKKQIIATAYTVTVTKSGISNAGSGGIIQSANITMDVNHSWVTTHGGTSCIVIMHRSDDGTTTLLTPAYDGLDDDTGNDIFTAFSPTGLSTFVLTAVAPIVTTSTTNSDSGSSWSSASADAAARENAAYSATAAITATPTGTPTPTATPVPAETTKLKVRITPWPTTQVAADPGQVAAEPVADIASAKISASGVLKNPYLFTAEAIAAVAIFSIGIAGYIKRRKRNRDPLRWEDRK